ncbi:MAG: ATP phosphoribosyltransferase, partial [Myxococcota bacterium]
MAQLQLALPKGRMHDKVVKLLDDAGVELRVSPRGYRPTVSLADVETKILKPQSIVEMVHTGTRDLGFAGADWVAELEADVVEVIDTRLDPVRVVAAAPVDMLVDGQLPDRPLVVASEYMRLTREWARPQDRVIRSYGATEVLPPEDADCIVDNT